MISTCIEFFIPDFSPNLLQQSRYSRMNENHIKFFSFWLGILSTWSQKSYILWKNSCFYDGTKYLKNAKTICAVILYNTSLLRNSVQFRTKYCRIHFNIDLFDYFLFMERIKMKLGNSMFPRLEISETNKFCKF